MVFDFYKNKEKCTWSWVYKPRKMNCELVRVILCSLAYSLPSAGVFNLFNKTSCKYSFVTTRDDHWQTSLAPVKALWIQPIKLLEFLSTNIKQQRDGCIQANKICSRKRGKIIFQLSKTATSIFLDQRRFCAFKLFSFLVSD